MGLKTSQNGYLEPTQGNTKLVLPIGPNQLRNLCPQNMHNLRFYSPQTGQNTFKKIFFLEARNSNHQGFSLISLIVRLGH